MYSDWSSVQNEIQTEVSHKSVLAQFPSSVGRDVSNAIVHSLAGSLVRSNEIGDASLLTSDAEVQWTMQVGCTFSLMFAIITCRAVPDIRLSGATGYRITGYPVRYWLFCSYPVSGVLPYIALLYIRLHRISSPILTIRLISSHGWYPVSGNLAIRYSPIHVQWVSNNTVPNSVKGVSVFKNKHPMLLVI